MSSVRNVQRTASGTFFITVPKSWGERYGLKRGSVVSLSETSDGRLLVDPKYGAEPSPQIITLRPGPLLSREILGKYLLGFDIIRVDAKERISFEIRDTVKKTVGRLIGLEIVEEDYASIILQCLLEPSGFPPEKILRRGYGIAAGMHRDVVNSFVDGDAQLAESVIVRDDESNRLYFLLVRILRTIVQNPSLSAKLGVSPIECLDYRLAASLVEAIGDECVRIALKTIELKGAKLTEDLQKLFVEFHMFCFEAHESALKAFFMGDIVLAEGVRGMREKMEQTFTNIEKVARTQSLDVVPQILAVASFLRQIYEHSVDIADLVAPKRL
ncbi:MAG: phosphate uptake regulator PhoU [Candidatus Bathyarchaeota archaeon]|nr:phosphate uptake regulator PhoU [Candidatus Bathyarchaeota archaeon]MDH5788309.1 phosphate uptake regulator PhoU [Candidatus Bathyarchaeota archaeon]